MVLEGPCLNSLCEGWALFLDLWFPQILQPRLPLVLTQGPLFLLVCHPHSPDSASYSSAIELYPEGMLPAQWEWSTAVFLNMGGPCPCFPLFPGNLKNLVYGSLSMDKGQVGHRDVIQPLVWSPGISFNFAA